MDVDEADQDLIVSVSGIRGIAGEARTPGTTLSFASTLGIHSGGTSGKGGAAPHAGSTSADHPGVPPIELPPRRYFTSRRRSLHDSETAEKVAPVLTQSPPFFYKYSLTIRLRTARARTVRLGPRLHIERDTNSVGLESNLLCPIHANSYFSNRCNLYFTGRLRAERSVR
jgi:hypothetical protein